MKPEDVPAEMVEKAARAVAEFNACGYCDGSCEGCTGEARAALSAVLPDLAQEVRNLGHAMREADGWDEEWSTREVRDALNIAADRIDRKGWS